MRSASAHDGKFTSHASIMHAKLLFYVCILLKCIITPCITNNESRMGV